MVSSYLVCDLCGRFGPPASNFSMDGLRLCYQCWCEAQSLAAAPAADSRSLDDPPNEPLENLNDPASFPPDSAA